MKKLLGISFILTGLFAILGGLYTWGDGSIFAQADLMKVLIPWADIILTGPLSIVCGVGIIKLKGWADIIGLVTSGIYIFGSLLVFISIFWNKNYSVYLIIPSISGFIIALIFIVLQLKTNSGFYD